MPVPQSKQSHPTSKESSYEISAKSPADRAAMLQAIASAPWTICSRRFQPSFVLTRDLAIPPANGGIGNRWTGSSNAQRKTAKATPVFSEPELTPITGPWSSMPLGATRRISDLLPRPTRRSSAQGTLQAIFEFQTMICRTHRHGPGECLDVRRLDGAAEAVMMAVRITGRHSGVIARSLHPSIGKCSTTYATHQAIPLRHGLVYGYGTDRSEGTRDAVDDDTACVSDSVAKFLRTIEDIEAIAEIAHSAEHC